MERILVVDDSATVRHMLKTHLGAIAPHARVEEAATAAEGVQAFQGSEFDLTFVDGVFSDGTPVVRVVEAMLAHRPTARVAVVTSRPRGHEGVAEALGLGAYAYLAKPVRRGDVEEIIVRVETDEGRRGRIR